MKGGDHFVFFRHRHSAKRPAVDEVCERRTYESWLDFHGAAAAFGLSADYTRRDVEIAFRRLARDAHPDTGGSQEAFHRLIEQRELLLDRAER